MLGAEPRRGSQARIAAVSVGQARESSVPWPPGRATRRTGRTLGAGPRGDIQARVLSVESVRVEWRGTTTDGDERRLALCLIRLMTTFASRTPDWNSSEATSAQRIGIQLRA